MPKAVREKLEFGFGSWASFGYPPFYQNFGSGDWRVASLLPAGCFGVAPFFALEQMLEFWQNIGAHKIRERIFALQSFLEMEADKELGWQKASPPAGKMRGPLLAYWLPEILKPHGDRLFAKMPLDIGVQIHAPIVLGKHVMRFTPHIYTTEAEIKEGIKRIKRIKNYRP
jgi:selenocysteine lyase/cysteine desulfurase